jgi:hypothetical protein
MVGCRWLVVLFKILLIKKIGFSLEGKNQNRACDGRKKEEKKRRASACWFLRDGLKNGPGRRG